MADTEIYWRYYQVWSVTTIEYPEAPYAILEDEKYRDAYENCVYFLKNESIGDTQGHDFAIIVCNSQSDIVIGYIPIA
jgi:hypothetical protein